MPPASLWSRAHEADGGLGGGGRGGGAAGLWAAAGERCCACRGGLGDEVDVLEAEYGTQTGGMWSLYRFKRGFGGRVVRHLGTFDHVYR